MKIACEDSLLSDRVTRRMVRGTGLPEGLGRDRLSCHQLAETWEEILQRERSKCRRELELEVLWLDLRFSPNVRRLTFAGLARRERGKQKNC